MKADEGQVPLEPEPLRLSELFHENSKQRRNDLDFNRRIYMVNHDPEFHRLMARAYKHYPGAAIVHLPAVAPKPAEGLEMVLSRRRSVRRFDARPLQLDALARLLGFSAGLTGSLDTGPEPQPVRAAPSAGALFPIETYVAVSRVEEVPAGVYHYRVDRHILERMTSEDPAPALAEATFDAALFTQAAAVLVLSGAPGRAIFKYGERGYRFALLEAGHLAQNALLVAASLGLGATSVGGFVDDEVNELLDLDGVDEAALYLIAVGHPAARDEGAADAAEQFLRALAESTAR